MINEIFVEESIADLPYTQRILNHFKHVPQSKIDNYENYWGRTKKPYLQKRENLKLFVAQKKGQLVKEAPDAYGTAGSPHYYFIHAYNCVYECQYCYLQGYFNTPDLVIFVNHDEIIAEMEKIVADKPDSWFHAGEFSDSLALASITKEWEQYFEFFARHKSAKLELRTKSSNVSEILKLQALPNVYASFSLSPEKTASQIDEKTPKLAARVLAMKKLQSGGHQLAIHFDPIIYSENFLQEYQELIASLAASINLAEIGYISLGVVRFTKDVYREVQKNYPKSLIHAQEFVKSFDGKVRYPKPMRMWMMNSIKNELMLAGLTEQQIYLCMEN
jgi:spore photoproduct lyase